MDDRSRKTLRRVKRNDSTLTKLEIGGIDRDRDSTFATFDINPDYEPHEGGIASSISVNDMIKFGTFLGKNKYIESLTVHRPTYEPCPHSTDDGSFFDSLTLEQLLEYEEAISLPHQFIEGLKRNSSITKLYLCNDNINNRGLDDGKVGFEILKIYQEKGNLTELFVMVCVLPSSLIANTIMSCTNLIEITLLHCNITDEQLLPLVEAIRHTSLEKYQCHVNIDMRLPDIDMEQLFEWGSEDEWSLKALPYIIDWFERATEAMASAKDKEWSITLIDGSLQYGFGHKRTCHIVSRRKLSAIYQFSQAMPLLFIPTSVTEDESTVKSRVEMHKDSERVEMKSMNKVATGNCCVIL